MPAEAESLLQLRQALGDLVAWCRTEAVPAVVIGGVAVAVLGRPRITRDVDALLQLDDERWPAFVQRGQQFGFEPRITDALAFAQANRVLLLRHKPSRIPVDLSFAGLPFEAEVIERACERDAVGTRLALPTPEDLIIMKAIAHRDKDLIDITGLLDVNLKLDEKRIERWVRDFADVMEMPEVYDDLKRLLAGRRKRKRKGSK